MRPHSDYGRHHATGEQQWFHQFLIETAADFLAEPMGVLTHDAANLTVVFHGYTMRLRKSDGGRI